MTRNIKLRINCKVRTFPTGNILHTEQKKQLQTF